MDQLSAADLYLARLAARPPYRWTIYTVFFLTATASLYLRVTQGRSAQLLPGYAALLSLYGFVMAAVARDARSRVVYACFGILVAAAFTRTWTSQWTRAVGLVEVAACLMLLAAFMSLSRDDAFRSRGAVLQSNASSHRSDQEDPHE